MDAYHAGTEDGIRLAIGAALRVACGPRAYLAERDWRMAVARFAAAALPSQDGNAACLIVLRAGSRLEVASRTYYAHKYATTQRMMRVAYARQTRVQNETAGNVYVARRYPATAQHPGGITVLTGRDCVLITVPAVDTLGAASR